MQTLREFLKLHESKEHTTKTILDESTPKELESIDSRLSELKQVVKIYQRLLNEIPEDRPERTDIKNMIDDRLKEIKDIENFKAKNK